MSRRLCHIDEIDEDGGKGFVFGEGTARREIFLVRSGEKVFGYENACPHLGSPLDFTPDRFLNAEGTHIVCATHGALFEIESGYCVSGPCAGDRLRPIALALDPKGSVIWQDALDAAGADPS